tara:strand:- start:597 stop:1595 length:999 start_codon:yes stop_codon:yes gene_type:complete
MSKVVALFEDIKKLDFSTLLEIQSAISLHVETIDIKGQLEQRGVTLIKSHCPNCGCDGRIRKWGYSALKTARLRCLDCKKTFSATTGTPFYRLRFRAEWLRYMSLLPTHISVASLRENFDFDHHVDTLLRWRHCFLAFISPNPGTRLSGVIQVDETYFRKSYKGHKRWFNGGQIDGRTARKRGGASKRGLSNEQVPVLTAMDTNNYICQQKLPDRKRTTITAAMRPWVQGQSVICSDGEPAYRSIATLTDCEHIRVKLKEKTRAPNLNLAKINAYHSHLKQLINGSCRGVNTEYLHLYLGWGRRWTQAGEFGKPIVREMLELALPSRPMAMA